MRILETERLILREFTTDDAIFILEILNSPTWLKFIGDRGVRTLDDARNYISDKFINSYKKHGFGLYLMREKKANAPVGMCGIIKRDTLTDPDIGFALLPRFENKGFGLEAAAATMNYAKNVLKLARIVAITDAENVQSINLLKKIGFQFEKMVKLTAEEELMLFATA